MKAWTYLGLKRIKGSPLQSHLRLFAQAQHWPGIVTQSEQEIFLIQLLYETARGVPAMRERLESASVLDGKHCHLENFHRIPPLTREDIAQRGELFTHQDAPQRKGLYVYQTGGSTGTPLKLVQDETYHDWCLASNLFFNTWNGLHIGTPYFFLWSAYRDLHQQLHSIKDRFIMGTLQSRQILNCRVTSPELLRHFIRTINCQTHVNHIVGYAYELYALAAFSLENGLPLNRQFDGVFATAEQLTDKMRETIEAVFGCKVLNRYGCRDVGDIACQCQEGDGMHINPLYTLVEVVDEAGQPVANGESGRILVTNLHNTVMPMIRYDLGDRVAVDWQPDCPCGRPWPMITQVVGRTNEKLYLPDGSWIGGAYFQTAFDLLPDLKRFQITQVTPRQLHIRLRSATPDYMTRYQAELETVRHKLHTWAGYPYEIVFEQCEEFERTPTGKELVFIQRLQHHDRAGEYAL
jgi:phenylacetate-CoA ligase